MYNKINLEILIQIIIEMFVAILLLIGLQSGKINLFVHPKFNIMLYFSCIILIVIAFFSVFQLFKSRHMNVLSKYFIIIIPLVMVFYMSKDIIGVMSSTTSISAIDKNNSYIPVSDQLQKSQEKTAYIKKPGEDYIEITEEQYLKWYYDSTFNWGSYKGTKFKFLCSVFKDSAQKGNFVVLGRMGMICCMADVQPCGFIYGEKGYENLKNGEWYWVEGEIRENDKHVYNYEKLPEIFNVKFEEAREPIDKFVYIQ